MKVLTTAIPQSYALLQFPQSALEYSIYTGVERKETCELGLWGQMRVAWVGRVISSPGIKGTVPNVSLSKSLCTLLICEFVWAGIILAPQDPCD